MNDDEKKLLSVEDVAGKVSVHPETIRRLIRAGELPASMVGSSYRIAPADLDAYLQAHRTGKP